MKTTIRLPNRRYLEAQLENRLDQLRRSKLSFGILFFDLDGFKCINDTRGHAAGDLSLKTIASSLAADCRPLDVLGRWGGDVFMAIMAGVDGETLEMAGNRMRALVAGTIIGQYPDTWSLTASLGAALADRSDTIETLLEHTDELLYQAKGRGGDFCCTCI